MPCLFGSVLTMSEALGNVVSWLTREIDGVSYRQHCALKLDDALMAAARRCATNAARLTVMGAPGGPLEPGKCADLVLPRLTGRAVDGRIRVKQTLVEGRKVV